MSNVISDEKKEKWTKKVTRSGRFLCSLSSAWILLYPATSKPYILEKNYHVSPAYFNSLWKQLKKFHFRFYLKSFHSPRSGNCFHFFSLVSRGRQVLQTSDKLRRFRAFFHCAQSSSCSEAVLEVPREPDWSFSLIKQDWKFSRHDWWSFFFFNAADFLPFPPLHTLRTKGHFSFTSKKLHRKLNPCNFLPSVSH